MPLQQKEEKEVARLGTPCVFLVGSDVFVRTMPFVENDRLKRGEFFWAGVSYGQAVGGGYASRR